MQATSGLYQELLASRHWKETKLVIGEECLLGTEQEEVISFGSTCIVVDDSGEKHEYGENRLISLGTSSGMFSQNTPTVGCCVSGEIDVEMLLPPDDIPRQACMVPYVRLTDGIRYSEWIQKGEYYIDTREKAEDGSGVDRMVFHGYDAMLKTEQNYPSSVLQWPAKDIDVVQEISNYIGVPVDRRTVAIMTQGYLVQYPGQYSCREVLGYIAAMYAGCFVINDLGELRLIALNGIPEETRYLVNSARQSITFGGVRILV